MKRTIALTALVVLSRLALGDRGPYAHENTNYGLYTDRAYLREHPKLIADHKADLDRFEAEWRLRDPLTRGPLCRVFIREDGCITGWRRR